MKPGSPLPLVFDQPQFQGDLLSGDGPSPLVGGRWFEAAQTGAGFAFTFPVGALAEAKCLWADFLLEGNRQVVFLVTLQEGADGPIFRLQFGVLNQCQARMRLDLSAVDQNRWMYPREGAWLKPMCWGDRVRLDRVDRMTFTVHRKADGVIRWCQTPIQAVAEAPPLLTEPLLPAGPLLDELGQSALHDWPSKTRNEDVLVERLQRQDQQAGTERWPDGWSRWGGWSAKRFEATGYFRTHHDGRRWWLVDPEGCAFWSTGPDCVRSYIDAACGGIESTLAWLPDRQGPFADAWRGNAAHGPAVNYLATNFIRAFGPKDWEDKWARIALAQMRRIGFNTVANWSEWEIAREAGFPYTRPLSVSLPNTPKVFRDFPDVFDPAFARDAAQYARQLEDTIEDPALIGYFLMNEPTWGFASEPVATGMLFTTSKAASRYELAAFVRDRYAADPARLQAQWGEGVTIGDIASGPWRHELTAGAREDLEEFSTIMVEKLFTGLAGACRAVDPNHLNLGARYYTLPPAWAVKGMGGFDVFSINWYRDRADDASLAELSDRLGRPILIGEWHFGALDAGLPASGIGHVPSQAARGQAYRVYLEGAAREPWCVGAHWFTLYDQSALGRFDGENYNIGFLDVCHAPYEPLVEAALASHRRLYAVAAGEEPPYDEPPLYLPKLFL